MKMIVTLCCIWLNFVFMLSYKALQLSVDINKIVQKCKNLFAWVSKNFPGNLFYRIVQKTIFRGNLISRIAYIFSKTAKVSSRENFFWSICLIDDIIRKLLVSENISQHFLTEFMMFVCASFGSCCVCLSKIIKGCPFLPTFIRAPSPQTHFELFPNLPLSLALLNLKE